MRWFWTVSFWLIESVIVLAAIPLVVLVYLPLVAAKALFAALRAIASGRRGAEPRPEAG